MDSTGKYAADYNPEIGCRTIGCTHDCSEDRSKSGYIKELDYEDLPCGHRLIIDSVLEFIGRGLA